MNPTLVTHKYLRLLKIEFLYKTDGKLFVFDLWIHVHTLFVNYVKNCLQFFWKLSRPYSYFICTIFKWKLTLLSPILSVAFVVVILVVAGARVN